jgi:hypothetical protein
MLKIFLFIAVIFNTPQPPEPTEKIKNFIAQLGNDDFDTRIQAEEELLNLKYTALKGCLDQVNNSDSEIAFRCQKIVQHYYDSIYKSEKYPSIYFLPEKIRYPLGVKYKIEQGLCVDLETSFDLSLYYFNKARIEWNEKQDPYSRISDLFVRNDDFEANAMRMFIRDLIHQGKSKEYIESILADIKGKKNLANKHPNEYWQEVPGPLSP